MAEVDPAFRHRLRVRYAECDPQGVVFNAHYLAYFDISLTELWRAAFGGYGVMRERGVDLVVAEAQVRYRSPAAFDDELQLEIQVAQLGNTSITSDHTVYLDGRVLAEGRTRHVVVELPTAQKTAIPEWLRQGLARYCSS